jgi:hypothetical protein
MFQRVHGLNPNGVLTDETYQALLSASSASVPPITTGDSSSVDTVVPPVGRGFTTYRRSPKAHWDAVCDLNETTEFAKFVGMERTSHAVQMENYLNVLSAEFGSYMEEPANQEAFLLGKDKHVQFTALTGLNNASHICDVVGGWG